MKNRPIIGISMGDPFGNGPEITVRALSNPKLYERCRPLVVGDMSSMTYALKVAKKVLGIDLKLHKVHDVSEAKFIHGTIDLLDMELVPVDEIPDTADLDVDCYDPSDIQGVSFPCPRFGFSYGSLRSLNKVA
jgi:4-hydroxy-L-threonine phosphate dehydrogenase PdxA